MGGPADRPFCFGTDRCMFGVDPPHFEAIWPETPEIERLGFTAEEMSRPVAA